MGSLAGAKQGAWLRVMTQAYVFVFSCSCSVFSLLLIKWEAERGDACSISWFIYTSVDVSAPLVLRRRLFDLLSLDDVQYLSAFLSSWAQSAASGRGPAVLPALLSWSFLSVASMWKLYILFIAFNTLVKETMWRMHQE